MKTAAKNMAADYKMDYLRALPLDYADSPAG
jgi:hypothetical protein